MAVVSICASSSDESSCGTPTSTSTAPSTAPATPDCKPLTTSAQADLDVNLTQLADDFRRDSFASSNTQSDTSSSGPIAVNKIACVGAGYVGGPTAAVIALHNPAISVEVLDRDRQRIERWRSPHLPLHEPGLDEIVRVTRDGAQAATLTDVVSLPEQPSNQTDDFGHRHPNLTFSTSLDHGIPSADIIFVAVNTPTKDYGLGAGKATNMAALDSAVKEIALRAKPGAIIVEKSTVPCGTAHRIQQLLNAVRPDVAFEVLSNPEFLSEGTAIKNLLTPDRVLIGSSDTLSGRLAAEALASVYSSWVPRSKIVQTNAWSSELSKLVANAMLAQRISSINSISEICERTGADVQEVATCVGLDPRIGPHFLKAGLGFGGSCFRKDICSLTYLAESLGLHDVAHYWSQVNHINNLQRQRFAKKVIRRLDENLRGKKIALLGFAFKSNTSDTRESPTVDVLRTLLDEQPAEVAIFDPWCSENDMLREVSRSFELSPSNNPNAQHLAKIYQDPYQACSQAHAVLVMTDCAQFRYPASTSIQPQVALNTLEKSTADSSLPTYTTSKFSCGVVTTDSTAFRLLPQPACPSDCGDCASRGLTLATYASSEPIEWSHVARVVMGEPKWVFDSRNILDVAEMQKLGFRVENLGRQPQYSETLI